jgi:hypothetical protein
MLFGAAEVRFVDTKLDVDESRGVGTLVRFGEGLRAVDWDEAEESGFGASELETEPEADATFDDLPAAAAKGKNYTAWTKEYSAWLLRTQKIDLLRSPQTGLISRPDESEREFRIRLQRAAREKRGEATERLRRKYAPKTATIEERLRRAEQAVRREEEQARDQQMQTAVSFGATLLGAFLGRKGAGGSIGRASSAARGISRTMRQSGDISRARETVETLRTQLNDLEADFRAEADALEAAIDPLSEELEVIAVRPKRTDVAVETVALVWVPTVAARE